MMTELLLYALLGSVTGVLAGLLGIGGGLVMVPAIVFFASVREIAVHLAIATSLSQYYFYRQRPPPLPITGVVPWTFRERCA